MVPIRFAEGWRQDGLAEEGEAAGTDGLSAGARTVPLTVEDSGGIVPPSPTAGTVAAIVEAVFRTSRRASIRILNGLPNGAPPEQRESGAPQRASVQSCKSATQFNRSNQTTVAGLPRASY
jgi:hypothetical protein